ncbi:MAG TPA: DUF6285 domain-containing protein [Burkholderiaceae bacterium]|jgi:hypothetical protein
MSTRIPPTDVLLRAATDYLEHELLPTLSGYHRFQTRVSINVLRTAMRELQLAASFDATEQARLGGLLGHAGDGPDPTAALNEELAGALAGGALALDAPGLVEHLRQTLADALAINNPKWIASDRRDGSDRPS